MRVADGAGFDEDFEQPGDLAAIAGPDGLAGQAALLLIVGRGSFGEGGEDFGRFGRQG